MAPWKPNISSIHVKILIKPRTKTYFETKEPCGCYKGTVFYKGTFTIQVRNAIEMGGWLEKGLLLHTLVWHVISKMMDQASL